MKIVFVTTESLLDHSYTMAEELKKKIEVKVIIIAKNLTPEISEFCKKLDAVFIKRARFINPLAFIREIQLMFLIRKQKADIVWFNTFSLYQSLLAKLFFSKLVINAHDIDLHPEESDYHGILSQKITFRFYKKSIAVMSSTQREIFKHKYGFKPFLLQLPIINYYSVSAGNNPSSIMEENVHKDPKEYNIVRFFFFGTILIYKGIERLLEAAKILEDKGLKFEINIYGRLKYNNEEILNTINTIKNVTLKNEFIDYREVFDVYNSNDIIIIPYVHVSQCGPLLISYNQNIPVICSDLPGFREYVTDGKSGLLFDNTAEGLANKMNHVINNPGMTNDMRMFIKSEIKNKFSMQNLTKDYLSVFERSL